MTDFNRLIAANPDDGYSVASTFYNATVSIGMGYGSLTQDAYFRFTNITIPKNSIINSAIIRFNCRYARSGTTVRTNIYIEDSDNPDAPTSESDLNGREVGSAVAWDGEGAWTADVDYDTPDFASILETHLARTGWVSGQALIVLILDDGSDESADRHAKARDYSTTDCAELIITYGEVQGELSDSLEIADTVDVLGPVDAPLQDDFSIDDSIIAAGGSTFVTAGENFSIDDSIVVLGPVPAELQDDYSIDDKTVAGFLQEVVSSDDLTIDDEVVVGFEYQGLSPDVFAISDLTDAFNWSQFLRENQDVAVIRYYFTLTGAADGTIDIEIPVSSIQARKRSGYSTQLTVVIKDYLTWAAAVTARPNGSMYIDMAYLVSGVEQFRERILIVDLDDIRLDKGSRSRAITLTGTRIQTFGAQVVEISDPSYRYLIDGKISYRFSIPDPWLDPGNTCVVGDDQFTVDWVNYVITENYRSMEVREV